MGELLEGWKEAGLPFVSVTFLSLEGESGLN